MLINSLSSNVQMYTVNCGGGGLSEQTIRRSKELGINPERVETETQAQILIAQAEAEKNRIEHNNGGNLSKQTLSSEIKTLAQNVGVNVTDEKKSTDSILNKIAEKIQEMEKEHFHKDRVREYKAQFEELAQRAKISENIQQNIFNNMNMVSISNKLILGL